MNIKVKKSILKGFYCERGSSRQLKGCSSYLFFHFHKIWGTSRGKRVKINRSGDLDFYYKWIPKTLGATIPIMQLQHI